MKCCSVSHQAGKSHHGGWKLNETITLSSVALYIISGPNWKNCRIQVNCEENEVFGQFTVALGDSFATWGRRRDPWSQKVGSDFGIGDMMTNGALVHHGKMHLVTFRGSGVIVRELNVNHMLDFALQSIRYSSLWPWFNTEAKCSWQNFINLFRKQNSASIPTCIGVTPWSYDHITWHDFVADTHNWMVYAGTEYAYKSMSYKLGSTACRNMLKRAGQHARWAPIPKNLNQPLSAPIFSTRVLAYIPHQRVGRIAGLPAY